MAADSESRNQGSRNFCQEGGPGPTARKTALTTGFLLLFFVFCHPDRYSNLFLNAYINRHVHAEYLIKALRVLMETMSFDFSSCRLSRVHFCR